MKIQDIKNTYQYNSFKEKFGDMEFEPKEIDVQTRTLPRDMNDKEILAEFKPEEITLGEFVTALDKLDKSGYYICYIKDSSAKLWAVFASWSDGGWHFSAYSVEYPIGWGAGRQVVSRRFLDSQTPSPLETSTPRTLNPIESLTLESAIKVCKEAGLVVYQPK